MDGVASSCDSNLVVSDESELLKAHTKPNLHEEAHDSDKEESLKSKTQTEQSED